MSGTTDPVGRGTGGDRGEISLRSGRALAESSAKQRSPQSSWLYLKQLLEPRCLTIGLLSSPHKSEKALILNMNTFVAVDISKETLEVRLPHTSISLTNDADGFEKLLGQCQDLTNPLVVFEATGGYEQSLKNALHDANVDLCLVNPARVRAFASSEGLKAKTDAIDAAMILRFAQEKRLKPTPAPSPAQAKLMALLDRRSQVSEHIAREKNRRQKAADFIVPQIDESIKQAEAQLQELERQISIVIRETPEMKKQDRLFQEVKGVGEITSWTLIAFLPEIATLTRNQTVAMAGVAPYNRDSGRQQKPRRIQGGRAKIRKVLYMAAQTAAIHNPVIKPYVQALRDRGKPYRCAIVAAMRKLLLHLRSLINNPKKTLAV